MDAEIRMLERAASLGDAVAVERLDAMRARLAPRTDVGKTLRKFSAVGPCLAASFGPVVRESASFWFYKDRNGAEKKAKKGGMFHVEACTSCRDHAHTDYPMGYMD